jgi:hypothetical protein
MTRKHFIKIAEVMRANNIDQTACWHMAQEFKAFNDLFDVNKFMAACGH